MDESLFRALAAPTRRRILELLTEKHRTSGEIAEQFPMAFASVSHYLGMLKAADRVVTEREGQLSCYWLIANAVILFLLLAHALIIASGLGYGVRIDRLMPLGVGLLFVFLGNYLTRVEPNWFIGIRTPWTLSSDTVWRRTHRTGGWLMVIGGLVLAIAAFVARSAFLALFVATIILVAVIPVVQSYVLWKGEQGKS